MVREIRVGWDAWRLASAPQLRRTLKNKREIRVLQNNTLAVREYDLPQ